MYKVPDIRMDWCEYESIRKHFQHKHAEMLRNYTPKVSPSCKWIQPGKIFFVNGIPLKKGFFYVGEFFDIPKSYNKKRYASDVVRAYNREYKLSRIFGPVIQEDLPIEEGELKIIPFSSYVDMHPTHRYEYLLWLAEKKQISEISSSILLLYLFGLQLRMFIDESTEDRERLEIIVHTLTLYSQCLKYRVHTSYLFEFEMFINAAIRCFFKGKELEILNSSLTCQHNEIQDKDNSLIFVICNYIAREQGKYIPEVLITNYFVKHVQQFVESEINKLVNNKDTTALNYLSFDYSFAHISGILSDSRLCYDLLLNIRLREEYQICYAIRDAIKFFCKETCEKLKEYRILNKISPTLSFLSLPSSFNADDYEGTGTYIERLRNKTASQEFVTISINEILDIDKCNAKKERTLDKNQITSIIKCINKIGYGIAPNYLVDETRLTFDDNCIIYKDIDSESISVSISHQLELLIKACVAIIDTTITETDISFIDGFVKNEVNHTPTRKYLAAYLRWITLSTYKLTKVDKNEIQKLPKNLKNRYCVLLVRLLGLNVLSISKREDKFKNMLPLFSVDSKAIHTLIHRSLVYSDEDFASIEKITNASEFTIDKPSTTTKNRFTLSEERLAKVEKQTKQAQDLLSDIFEDNGDNTNSIAHENNVFKDVLKILLTKESWKRNEVENLCKERHLMLGSVLEQINDYSYGKIEDAIIEDDGDTIYVMTDYKEKLI